LFKYVFQFRLQSQQFPSVSRDSGEARGVGDGKKSPHNFSRTIVTTGFGEQLEDVIAYQSTRLGWEVWSAGDAHGADRCSCKTFRIARLRSLPQSSPLTSQGTSRASPHEDLWMLLQIPAAAVPAP
jgi:hypothetical protein